MICTINPTCPREQGENGNYMNRNKLTKKKKRGAGVRGKKQRRGIGIIWDVLPL